MSYLALARKWRPRTFEQLVGQEHITKALTNALDKQRIHHAYLFTGTRGVGKTSVARLLAKALNCEQGVSAKPCLTCEACTAIEQGRFIDLLEIDGASKTRVEDTRDLLDNVQYATTSGRFKIYLIDEVHMLSQHSFNALLKTLEEPPAHVKFILATTDPQKLPVTVLSRCLQFNLKILPQTIICQQLQNIVQDEQLDYDMQALDLIAQAARGSMRDALSLLDHAISGCDNKLMTTDVNRILGYTQVDYAMLILQALAAQNPNLLMEQVQHIEAEGSPFPYVLDAMLQYLHQMSVYHSLGDNNPLISPSAAVKAVAKAFTAEDLQLFYHIGIHAREEIHLAPTLSIGFSMTLLRMLTFRPAPEVAMPPLAYEHVPPTPVPPSPAPPAADWQQILSKLALNGLALNALEHSEWVSYDNQLLTLAVDSGHRSLFTTAVLSRIEKALTDYYQQPTTIALDTSTAVTASPAQQKTKHQQQKQQQAEQALAEDPVFQQIQQDFSAELVKGSVMLLD